MSDKLPPRQIDGNSLRSSKVGLCLSKSHAGGGDAVSRPRQRRRGEDAWYPVRIEPPAARLMERDLLNPWVTPLMTERRR